MLLKQISDYAVREQTAKLPKEVIHHAKRAVIDWYASLLPGSRIAPATLLEEALADELDHGRARLASGRRATVRAAALINGAASHAVEFDDIWRDAVYHPASPVISAACPPCRGLLIACERNACCRPAAKVPALPSACAKRSRSQPRSVATAAAAPNVPTVPVVCQYL